MGSLSPAQKQTEPITEGIGLTEEVMDGLAARGGTTFS